MPRRWLWTEVCLALIIALCVPYLLIRPALARELLCQIPEHTHTDSCYTQLPAELDEGEDGDADQPLTCTITDETHVHGPRCYGTWVLTCGLEEHTHTEACYLAENTLPETPAAPDTDTPADGDADASETPAGSETGGDAPTRDPADPDTQAGGTLEVSLLYGDGKSQAEHPDGVDYYTHSTMAGFIRLKPKDLDEDPTNLTVTLSMPKQYVEKDSIRIPPFSTNSTVTQYEIGFVEENGENYSISIYFTVYDRTQTLMLPTYTDRNGVSRIAVFDADQNPGWTLSEDEKAVSRTYTGERSAEILLQIYNDALHLRFPGLRFTAADDGTPMAELSNSVVLTAIPSGEAPGETHPEADDPLRFRLTTDPTTQGKFTKGAEKGDIYDVEVYKTNPYPWSLALSNGKSQPLRHIMIQDRTIVEDGEVVLAGLDEALRFVRLESGHDRRFPAGGQNICGSRGPYHRLLHGRDDTAHLRPAGGRPRQYHRDL